VSPSRLRPLTAEAFAPYGEVIEAAGATVGINAGTAARYPDLAQLDAGPSGRLAFSLFRAVPRPLPFTLQVMERHPLGSQLFFPVGDAGYVVAVAPAGPAPSVAEICLFVARPGQGVNFARGVWHHPLIALFAPATFVVVDRIGEGENCDEIALGPDAPVVEASAVTALLGAET
jgi:ureidoglycolate lyase